MRNLFVWFSPCAADLPDIAGAQSHVLGFPLGSAEWNNTVYGGGHARRGVVPFVGAGYVLLYEATSKDHHHQNIILLKTEGLAAIEHNTRDEINFHSAMNAVAGILVNA